MEHPGAPKTIKNPVLGSYKPGFWRRKPLFFMVLGAPGLWNNASRNIFEKLPVQPRPSKGKCVRKYALANVLASQIEPKHDEKP